MNWIGRFAYRVVSIIGRFVPLWSRHRVRIVVFNDRNEVLLVKTWLSEQYWSLPGGGIAHGESPVGTAVRELHEETGLRVEPKDLTELTTTHEQALGIILTIFRTTVAYTPQKPIHFPHSLEIIDSRWWTVSSLPPDMTDYSKTAIRLALESES